MTRYRLDSQFHCLYLESKEVPGKKRGKNPVRKKAWEIRVKSAGNYLSFISGSSSRLPVTSLPVMQVPVTSPSTTNTTWMVHIYYLRCIYIFAMCIVGQNVAIDKDWFRVFIHKYKFPLKWPCRFYIIIFPEEYYFFYIIYFEILFLQ